MFQEHMLSVISAMKNFLEHFIEKTGQNKFGLKKYSGEKAIDCSPNAKAMIIHIIAGLI